MSSSSSRLPLATLTCCALLGALLTASPVAAQTREAATPSDGVPLPDRSITAQDDAASVEVNPAGLGFMQSVEFQYNLHLATPDYARTVDSGHAVFLAAGAGGLGFGFGAQFLFSPDIGGPDVPGDYRKYTFAGALGDGDTFSLGAAFNFFGADRSQALDDLRTIDVGAQLRLSQYLAFGLFARDTNTAYLSQDAALPVRYGAGALLRLWDGRLQLDQEVGYTRESRFIDLTSRVVLEFVDGLRFFGRGEFRVTTDRAIAASALEGVTAGLELSFGSIGAQAAVVGQYEDGAKLTGHSYSVWGSPSKKRSLITLRERWVLFELANSFQDLPSAGFFGPSAENFTQLLINLDEIAASDTIEGVVLNVSSPGLGWGQSWELIERLQALRAAGKKTVAIMQSADTRSIMIASVAEHVWMTPNIVYEPLGFQAQLLNYEEVFQKIGVKAEFLRVRDYKTSPEAYVNAEPSKESLEQVNAYLDVLFDGLVGAIATGREKTPEQVKGVIDNAPLLPDEALEQGYIDAIIYPDEVEDQLKQTFGKSIVLQKGWRRSPTSEERWERNPAIGILVISGAIVSGSSGASPLGSGALAGSDTIIGSIQRMRRNRNIKAVVVRIDSPGGSALASEQMYRELRRLAQEKPVIASMGNIAASGGYYVAAGTDEIFATPLTLTGSIGIFTGKFSFGELADAVGINITGLPRGERSGTYSLWTPFNDEQRAYVAKYIAYLYRLFLTQVAHTRPLTVAQIDEVARGHVWTGEAALQRELVDHSGGLIQTIRRAEELAGLKPRQARYEFYPGSGAMLSTLQQTRAHSWLAELVSWRSAQDEDLETLKLIAKPFTQTLRALGAHALYPMLYEQGEALMLPPHVIVIN